MASHSMSDEAYAGWIQDKIDGVRAAVSVRLAAAADKQDEAGREGLSNVLEWASGAGGDAATDFLLGESGNASVATEGEEASGDSEESEGMSPLMIGGLVVAGLALASGIGYVVLGD